MKTMKSARLLRTTVLTLLSAATLFVGCKKEKEEPKPVVPPTIETFHSISGNVVDKAGTALSDVKVELTGVASASATTNAKGEFTFVQLTKTGDYVITVTKAKFHTTKSSVTIADGSKTAVSMFIPITMVDEGVKKEISKAEGGKIELGNKTESIPGVEFIVPANALGKTETITITPVTDITKTSSGATPAQEKKGLPLLTLECAPAGIEFASCELVIPNPLGEFSIAGLKLMYHDGKAWATQPQGVIVRDGNYVTTISHFSTYQVAFNSEVVSTTPTTNVLSDVNGIDNLDGKKEIYVESIPYTFSSGYEYVITIDQALATAGITGADAAKVKDVIEQSIKSNNNGMAAGYKKNNGAQVINKGIPAGVRLDVKGVQNFSTIKYKIDFQKGATQYPVIVSIKVAGTVAITTQTYNKQHQGGNAGL